MSQSHHDHTIRGRIFAGILAVIPVWVSVLVVDFMLQVLSSMGHPFILAMVEIIEPIWPALARWLTTTWFEWVLAIAFVLFLLYLIGFVTTRVIGRRLMEWFDAWVERIPMVQTIYKSTKKMLVAFQKKPDKVHRVVLIDFPSKQMKTVGLVTRTLEDEHTGRKLAAVYVPTTPNPTSGYLEIVPIERCISTNWTFDEAMAFVISAGAVAPSSMPFYEKPQKKSSSKKQQDS